MKNFLQLSIAALASLTLLTTSSVNPATAGTFGHKEVEQDKFIAIAVPRGGSMGQLLILEQISKSQACWKESGAQPVNVDPLLLNFDFTGICGRSTDSNGYSVRMAGQDLGLQYGLSLVRRNGEMLLVATSNQDRNAPVIEIGRTYGTCSGFSKIILAPGWRFTKRTYKGKTLGHIYLTNDSVDPSSIPQQQRTSAIPTQLDQSVNSASLEGL